MTHPIHFQDLKPEYLGLISSGLTASIGLREAGRMTSGETVLVTAGKIPGEISCNRGIAEIVFRISADQL